MSVDCVILKQNGEIGIACLSENGAKGGKGKAAKAGGGAVPTVIVTPEFLMTKVYKKKKGDPPSLLGRYQWKQKTLFLFGYDDGKPTQENQHQLPPPLEGAQFYDDILVIASLSPHNYSMPTTLSTTEYESFYTAKMEGDDDMEEEDMEEMQDAMNDTEQVVEDEADGDDQAADDYTGDGDDDAGEEEGEEDQEEEDGEGDDDAGGWDDKPVTTITPTLKKKSEGKKKPANTAIAPLLSSLSTDPECQPTEPPTHPVRRAVASVICAQFSHTMNDEEMENFEQLLFQTTLNACDKKKIRRSWGTLGFKDLYLSITRTIIGNLNPNSYVQNKELWQMYVQKEITLEEIVRKNALELFPDHWRALIDQQAKREKIQLEGDRSRATDRFHCNRCGKKETTYYELQTRSADEPMTIFISCLNCGKRWTQ